MSLGASPFTGLWAEALASPAGLWLATHNVARLQAELYSARARSLDDRFRMGRVLTSPLGDRGHLWLVFPHHLEAQ